MIDRNSDNNYSDELLFIYLAQNDQDSWVVIETNNRIPHGKSMWMKGKIILSLDTISLIASFLSYFQESTESQYDADSK